MLTDQLSKSGKIWDSNRQAEAGMTKGRNSEQLFPEHMLHGFQSHHSISTPSDLHILGLQFKPRET